MRKQGSLSKYNKKGFTRRYITDISQLTGLSEEDVGNVLKSLSNVILQDVATCEEKDVVNCCFPYVGRLRFSGGSSERRPSLVKVSLEIEQPFRDYLADAYFNNKSRLCEDLDDDISLKLKSIVFGDEE